MKSKGNQDRPQKHVGELSVREAGRLGGQKVRELIEKGKRATEQEQGSRQR